jgi:hypothetical protein
MVSGVVGLVLSCDPQLTPGQVKDLLLETGTPVPGLDVASGEIVNAAAAVSAACATAPTPPSRRQQLFA